MLLNGVKILIQIRCFIPFLLSVTINAFMNRFLGISPRPFLHREENLIPYRFSDLYLSSIITYSPQTFKRISKVCQIMHICCRYAG